MAWLGVLLLRPGRGVLAGEPDLLRSFRVGIDNEHPDKLVTTGVFAYSRNPIYVGFIALLLGQFRSSPTGFCWSTCSPGRG